MNDDFTLKSLIISDQELIDHLEIENSNLRCLMCNSNKLGTRYNPDNSVKIISLPNLDLEHNEQGVTVRKENSTSTLKYELICSNCGFSHIFDAMVVARKLSIKKTRERFDKYTANSKEFQQTFADKQAKYLTLVSEIKSIKGDIPKKLKDELDSYDKYFSEAMEYFSEVKKEGDEINKLISVLEKSKLPFIKKDVNSGK